jgi:hypothetical protein
MRLSGSDVFSSVGKISLDDLAGLISGGKKSAAFFDTYQPKVHKDFPRGDERLIIQGDAHGTSMMYKSAARNYWKANFPRVPVDRAIAYPDTPEGWVELVEVLEAENLKLKALAEVASGESLPVNATDDMRTCIEVSQKYWTNTSKAEGRDTWNKVKTIEDWIIGNKEVSKSRATAIQQITRPEWATGGGRDSNEY